MSYFREGNSEQRIKFEKKPQLSKSDACLSSNKCNKKLQPMKGLYTFDIDKNSILNFKHADTTKNNLQN